MAGIDRFMMDLQFDTSPLPEEGGYVPAFAEGFVANVQVCVTGVWKLLSHTIIGVFKGLPACVCGGLRGQCPDRLAASPYLSGNTSRTASAIS